MTTTIQTVEEFQQVWSCFHKDAYGFRPRGAMPNWTVAQWDAEFQRLAGVCERNRIEEEASQAQAAEEVEALFDRLITGGAPDRVTALRWLHDAHDTGGNNEHLCFQLGLPYGYFATT